MEWSENGKCKRLSVGRDSDAAHLRQIRKLVELRAFSQGLVVTDVEEEANTYHVKVAVHDFLEEVKLTKQDKTWRGYLTTFLDAFSTVVHHHDVSERSSTGRFEAYSCKPAPGGLLPSSVQHQKFSLLFVTHCI
jgi:hypothetical protein